MSAQPECLSRPSTLVHGDVSQTSPLPAGPAPARRPIWLSLGFAVLLFTLIWFVYRSSLAHVPRSDQWSFLLDTVDQHGFVETFRHTYSYNRTREVGPGDYQLFRPVLFAFLSAEKALFDNNFAGWQWVGIVLHFLAAYLALQVMLRMQCLVGSATQASALEDGWFSERLFLRVLPYGLVLFWAMNFAVTEIVIFSHINGYVLFLVLVLGGLLFLLEYLARPNSPRGVQLLLLTGSLLLLLLSAFTHEIGQFLAIAVGVVLALTEHGRGRLARGLVFFSLFAGILLLYQTVNYLDKRSHPVARPDLDFSEIVEQVPTVQSIEHASRYLLFTTVQPFFPSCAKWSFAKERLDIKEPLAVEDNYRRGGPLLLLSYLVVGTGLVLAARGVYFLLRGNRSGSRLLLLLPVSLFVFHLAVTVFGRMNMRPSSQVLSINSYYTYIPLLSLLMSLNLIWSRVPHGASGAGSSLVRYFYGVFLGGLLILTLYSGEQACSINVAVKSKLRSFHAGAQWVVAFIQQHQHEPDFSFAFDPDSYEEMETANGIPLPVILFKQHLNNRAPKYLVSWRGSKCTAALYNQSSQVFPDVVKVGTPYNIFYFDGYYYGVLDYDGYYDPDRDDYLSLIIDPTLEGALRRTSQGD